MPDEERRNLALSPRSPTRRPFDPNASGCDPDVLGCDPCPRGVLVSCVVIDRDAASSKRALDELLKPGVRKNLLRFAIWRTRSEADAEDLLQDALAKVFDPDDSPWDSDRGKSFFSHVASLMSGLASNESRSSRALHEVVDSTLARDDATVDGAPLANEALDAHRELARFRDMGERLLAKLGEKHPIATKAFRLAMEGFESPAEQAERIPCLVEEVYDAYRVLRYHARLIRAEEEEAEARRMRERREKLK
jgi:DNA-directed RNA polymerase specialized sigma24 family protein